MEYSEFRRSVFDPMTAQGLTTGPRLASAYEDVLSLAELTIAAATERGSTTAHVMSLSTPEREAALRAHPSIGDLGRRASALHKALIVFSVTFVHVLLHDAFGRPAAERTVGWLASQPLGDAFGRDTLLNMYRTYVFRNKLLIHHEALRMDAAMTDADGSHRLRPLRPAITVPSADVSTLMTLRTKYAALGGVGGETNHHALVEALFDHVPVRASGQFNPDRATINEVAERAGCRSQTPEEVVAAVDAFAVEAAALAPL